MFVSMEFSTYIKDLLYRYECVIIPGFGAFLTQYQPAKIIDDTAFYPPSKRLAFNRQLQTNDGILANYVASVEGCSYEVALQKIRNFAGTISLQLSEGETVGLNNIGDFTLNQDRKLEFTATNTTNYNTASFGLAPFNASIITTENEAVPVAVKSLQTSQKSTTIPWMRYAAVGLIAITLGGATGLKVYENSVEAHNFAAKQEADSQIEAQIQEATFVIDNPLPSFTLSLPKKTGKYHLVAGAFKFPENAEKRIQQLIEKGYPARSIGANKYGLHQVVYDSYNTREQAINVLRTIKRTENSNAWMLVQDLDQ